MSDEDSSGWQLTESDPGVFTELLKTLGVPYIVDDLYSLEPGALSALQPLHALIFLFKCLPSPDPASAAGQYDTDFPGFFAQQTVNNACATLAVINALGNIPSLSPGPQLADLLAFTSGMDPQTCGMAVTSADWLREAHNALSPPSSIALEELGLPKKTEEVYHFVVYLPVMGTVYELDGLKPYPVRHGEYDDDDGDDEDDDDGDGDGDGDGGDGDGDDDDDDNDNDNDNDGGGSGGESGENWLTKVKEVIEHRISTYPTGTLEFSLLALRDDPLPSLKTRFEYFQQIGRQSEASQVLAKIRSESSKRERWTFENSLRRHNHIGLAHALLLALAKAGRLEPAVVNARSVMRERLARRREMGLSGNIDDE